jgi:hypothetical protein
MTAMFSFRKLAVLYDNYVPSVTVLEDHTQQEQQEEWDFLQVDNSRLVCTTVTYKYIGACSCHYHSLGIFRTMSTSR